MRRLVCLLAVALSVNIAEAGEVVLTQDSYGAIKFGSRIIDVEKNLEEKAKPDSGEVGCDFVQFRKYPKASFMVEDGIITRADIHGDAPNILRISVGTSLASIKKKYPRVLIKPHHYDPTGQYLIFKNRTGVKAIVMEAGKGKVTDIRAGLLPSVEYVEGCL